MPTIRQLIRKATMNSDDRLLTKHGVVSETGALTSLGRRVLCDVLFAANKAEVVKLVQMADEKSEDLNGTSTKKKKKK